MERYQLSLPGPTECDPEVLAELQRPNLPHYGELWLQTYLQTLEHLRRIYQTDGDVYILPGSGSCGLDAVFTSLGPKQGIVLSNGTFGQRLYTIASRHLARMTVVEKQPGEPFTIEDVERALGAEHYDLLAVVHGETSTGMLNRLESLAELCHRRQILLVVDAISTLGGVPLSVDRLGIDFCVSASQKALGSVPGLATVSISDRGWQAMPPAEAIHGWYLNLRTWSWYEREWGDWHPYPITLPVHLFLALKKAMEILLREGLENSWQRHRLVSEQLQDALERIKVTLFIADRSNRLPTVTAGLLPPAVQTEDLQKFLRDEHGILIAGGVGPLRKRLFRIGHMGYSAQGWLTQRVVSGIADFMQRAAGPARG